MILGYEWLVQYCWLVYPAEQSLLRISEGQLVWVRGTHWKPHLQKSNLAQEIHEFFDQVTEQQESMVQTVQKCEKIHTATLSHVRVTHQTGPRNWEKLGEAEIELIASKIQQENPKKNEMDTRCC